MDIEQKRELLWSKRATLARVRPWKFLEHFTYTFDAHDPSKVAKKFPGYAYQRILCRLWEELPVLFIAKSRQIMMTWEIAALTLWDTIFKVNRLQLLQSKKEDDAADVLERATFIYEQLEKMAFPDLPKAKHVGEKAGTKKRLEFPGLRSKIMAIPQGGAIVRMHTCSGIFSDEINHQTEGKEAYGAAKPTISGGGRWTAGGTANGRNWVYRLMHNIDERSGDTLGGNLIDSRTVVKIPFEADGTLSTEQQRVWVEKKILSMSEEEFYAVPIEELVACVPGMDYWKTNAGFDCLRVHYSACIDKDPCTATGKRWYDNEKLGTQPDDWEREYEINYDTFKGRPVIGNWSREVFVKPVTYDYRLPLLTSVDFGSQTSVAFFAQLAHLDGGNAKQLRFLSEIVLKGQNANTPNLARMIVQMIQGMYMISWENANMRCFPDPAGHQNRETTSDSSQTNSIQILQNHGIRCTSKMLGIVESTQIVKAAFAMFYPTGEPAISMHPRCEYLIRVVGGGWHYPDKEFDAGVHQGKPEKDGEFDHGGDTLRHMVANTFSSEDFGRDGPKRRRTTIVRDKYTGVRVGVSTPGARYDSR